MFHTLVRWDATSIAKWECTMEVGKNQYVWRIGGYWFGPTMWSTKLE